MNIYQLSLFACIHCGMIDRVKKPRKFIVEIAFIWAVLKLDLRDTLRVMIFSHGKKTFVG